MFEFLATGCQLIKLRSAALRNNGVASVAVAGFDGQFLVRSLVVSIMTTETSGPILVADVIWVAFPTRLHLREEIVGEGNTGFFSNIKNAFKK